MIRISSPPAAGHPPDNPSRNCEPTPPHSPPIASSNPPLPSQGLFYFLGTRPNPVSGLLDFFVLGPATKAASGALRGRDFVLRDKCVATSVLDGGQMGAFASQLLLGLVKHPTRDLLSRTRSDSRLGGGNFGVTFEAIRVKVIAGAAAGSWPAGQSSRLCHLFVAGRLD
jgi:hypothetical protein